MKITIIKVFPRRKPVILVKGEISPEGVTLIFSPFHNEDLRNILNLAFDAVSSDITLIEIGELFMKRRSS